MSSMRLSKKKKTKLYFFVQLCVELCVPLWFRILNFTTKYTKSAAADSQSITKDFLDTLGEAHKKQKLCLTGTAGRKF
jgi:hypothetical protein